MNTIPAIQNELISKLKKDLLLWQGSKLASNTNEDIGLGVIEAAFPGKVFPKGTIHEFLTAEPEHAAASSGFISGLLASLMQQGGTCLWIGIARTLFPPALKSFGIEPDKVIFIDLKREKDVLWATEEALKCVGLAAVIGEIRELSFAQSRRLQLVVEKSNVTGFILRADPNKLSNTTCAARWRITPLPSDLEANMPGVGFPRWNVELLKVRNGNPGAWKVEWAGGQFIPASASRETEVLHNQRLKAG